MHIDWFTVAAQALNFLVLMWLLKRFLYQPILNTIAARERYIADQLADANNKEAKAQKTQKYFKQQNESFDKQKEHLLSDATKKAETVRNNLLQEAKEEADALRTKRKEALEQEMHNLMDNTTKQLRKEVFATATKLLRDLADVSLEERMIAIFITRLQELKTEDLSKLGVSNTSQPVHISSAFTLTKAMQTSIKKAIKEVLHTNKVNFKTVPELLSGIEFAVAGNKLTWSASDYLSTLEESVVVALKNEGAEHAD